LASTACSVEMRTAREAVARLLGERKPRLMVTDPPYGIELDSEWRDRAGLNGCGPAEPSYLKKRTAGHTETSISGDTRADWSEAFALVPSLEAAYVWHASKFTRSPRWAAEDRLHSPSASDREQRPHRANAHTLLVCSRTLLVRRKKNAPWLGKPGENSTIWDSPSRNSLWAARMKRSTIIQHKSRSN
jgi:hypothetical protein